MNPTLKKICIVAICIFAVIGFCFTLVFLGMRLGLFNVKGSIGERNKFFTSAQDKMAAAVIKTRACVSSAATCEWNATPEWEVVKGGLEKDAAVIARVSAETSVSGRMIASVVVPEQTRFFTAEREVFKRYFEPLKILGSLTQFSLGVSGIKQETAVLIEKYANDPTSEFYPGDGMSGLIAYPEGADHDAMLYDRLTDSKNHYYQYVYTAIYIREIQSQWKKAGYDITATPEAIVTLFNIGFAHSQPKADPKPGGAGITTGGTVYTYGELGALFYRSSELTDLFPRG